MGTLNDRGCPWATYMRIEKDLQGSAHLQRRMGAAFMAISSNAKATVGKGVVMTYAHFSPLSPRAIRLISRGSLNFKASEQDHGFRYRVDYPNGYGASIIKTVFSYGREQDLWELAVFHHGSICYDTPITSDVCGYLTTNEVIELCADIQSLDGEEG